MDVRVEFARPAAGTETGEVRAARADDVDALRAIARTNHDVTRFYADPGFPDERCDELYDTWIRRSCEGWADAVLVTDVGDAPAGYVSCHLDAERRRGSIGLIGVAASARGRGLGAALVQGAVHWCRGRGVDEVTVVTQGCNVAAQRLFERFAFRTASLGLWFHKWYGR